MKKFIKVEVMPPERKRSRRTKKILDLRKLESIEVPVFELPAQAIESLLIFDA